MIGKYGSLRKSYLIEHKPVEFNILAMQGELWGHLEDVNEQATRKLHVLMSQMEKTYGVTEDLKEYDQMEWVGKMNSIKAACEEIVFQEFVYI